MSTVTSITNKVKGAGRRLKFATGVTVTNHRIKNVEMSWGEFVKRATVPVRTKEKLAEYLKMPLATQNTIKDVGYVVPGHFEKGIRKKSNITMRDCVMLDVDHAPPDYMEDIEMTYGDYAYALHSTHKHQPKLPRLRLVFPLTRSVDEVEYLAVSRKLASLLNIEWYDDTTYQFSRVMHWPSCASDSEFVHAVNEGAWVDPTDILAMYNDWRDASQWPVSSRQTQELRLSAVKAGNPEEKTGVVGAFCRTYDIVTAIEAFIPDAYTPGSSEDRLTYSQGSAHNGAVIYDDGLFLYSHHEHDPCSLRLVNAWDLVRLHKFGSLDADADRDTPVNQLPSSEAMSAFAREIEPIKAELMIERLQLGDDFDDIGNEIHPEQSAEITDLDDELGTALVPVENAWVTSLRVNDKGGITSCLTNLELILENDPKLAGVVAHNQFTAELLQMRPIPDMKLRVPEGGALWSDLAELKIAAYLERRYRITFPITTVYNGCCTIGDRHGFNPVTNYLDALPSHDMVPRLDDFFVREFGATDSTYIRAVTRKWFCAMIARAYMPGIKFDYMLVLEGMEGIRKSSFYEVLSGDHFTDSLSFGMDPKEVVEVTRNAWIAEIPEMITRSNAATEHVKAFLSRRTDRARLAYARNAGDFKRQFVIAGSTNESTYLRSLTGNRRFWPVNGDGRVLDLERIASYRDQLFAEAKERWIDGEKLWLDTKELVEAAAEQQTARIERDDLEGYVTAWLNKPIKADHWDVPLGQVNELDAFDDLTFDIERDRVCVAEVWCECLNEPIGKLNKREANRIADLLRSLPGWVMLPTIRFGVRYGRTRGFMKDILSAVSLDE